MSREDRPLEAPKGAAGDSIILHVPACVQRFSSQRRVLSRLRALARRRSRGLPELEAPPLKLQVEENPNWPPRQEPLETECAVEYRDWSEEGAALSPPQEAPGAELTPEAREAAAAPAPEFVTEPVEDPNTARLHQLEEDNRDLKAALCQLIRIAEENNAALRLLEDENEELSALVHRLTVGGPADASRPAAEARGGKGVRPSSPTLPHLAFAAGRLASGGWLKRRLDRRCS